MPPKLAISKKPHFFQRGGKTCTNMHTSTVKKQELNLNTYKVIKKCTGIDPTSKKQSY